MRDRVFVPRVGRGREASGHEVRQGMGTFLRPIHADEMTDRGRCGRRLADRFGHVVRVDDNGGFVIGEIVGKLVGELDVDQSRDRADAPSPEHGDQIVEPVMGENRDSIPLADAEFGKGASHALHRLRCLGVNEGSVAVDPAPRNPFGASHGSVEKKLMYEHGAPSRFGETLQEGTAAVRWKGGDDG